MSGALGGLLKGIGAANALGSILFGDDGPVVLGPVVFQELEVPGSLTWGGQQQLIVHKMPGGKRVIDALGRDDAPISWSGIVTGPNDDRAERAFLLDDLRASGLPVPLSFSTRLYIVVVRDFQATERAFQTEYRITCEVLYDASGAPAYMPKSLLGEITDAINRALTIATPVLGVIGIGGAIIDDLTATQTTVQTASGLTAGDDTSVSLQAAVTSTQADCVPVQDGAEAALAGLDGDIPLATSDPTEAVANLEEAANQSGAGGAARIINALMQRGYINLTTTPGATDALATFDETMPPLQTIGGGAGQTIMVSGGNLFAVAAAQLGDATQAYRIMLANGINDPMLSGNVALTIPDAIQAISDGVPALYGAAIL